MNRRVESNHALAYAVEMADRIEVPVLFYEGLTCSYPQATGRFHTFLLEAVPGTARRLQALGIGYLFHLAAEPKAANDAFYLLAADAAAVMTDDYPVFVARDHNRSVPQKLAIPCYAVDSSCIVPMSHFTKQEYAAYTIRPKIRKVLDECLQPAKTPRVEVPLHGCVARAAHPCDEINVAELVADCEIDHSIPPSTEYRGGRDEAERRLRYFLENNLRRYAKLSREPSAHATSELSPYLHFGHISSLEVALAVRDYAAEHKLIADEFLEHLIVRRELAFQLRALLAVARFAQCAARLGAGNASPSMFAIDAIQCTPASNLSAPQRTMPCGTPHKPSCSRAASSTATIGCIGGRRFWSGRLLTRKRWRL